MLVRQNTAQSSADECDIKARCIIDLTENAEKFEAVLEQEKEGTWIIYHRGEHCGGKHRHAARASSDAGHVRLLQRRLRAGTFEYLAVVCARHRSNV